MPRVLVTAFEPYERWTSNASWLCLMELTKEFPAEPKLVTRRYPVDFDSVPEKLAADIQGSYDFTVHLGQAPGIAHIQIETIAVNVRRNVDDSVQEFGQLVPQGPQAYRTELPVGQLTASVRKLGIPAVTSFHAGTYLCNGIYYWAMHLAERDRLPTKSLFIHLPLDPTQVAAGQTPLPSMPARVTAQAVRAILQELCTAAIAVPRGQLA